MYNPLDDQIIDYCVKNSSDTSEILAKIERNANLKTTAPQMITGPLLANFFKWLIQWTNPKKILEIGTFVGYGATIFALYADEDAIVDTIEVNPEYYHLANQHFEWLPNRSKVNNVLADARLWVEEQNSTWDLILIDAAKKDNLDYYQMLLPKLSDRGVMCIDNTLWKGKVLKEQMDKKTKLVDQLNATISEDTRVEKLLLPIVDGLTLIRKKAI